MTLTPIHIAAGSVSILAGFVALYAVKGSPLHRKSGAIFFWAMVAMTCSAIVIGVMRGHRVNTSQAFLTLYLVVTALLTFRRKPGQSRWILASSIVAALGIAGYDFYLTSQAMASARRSIDGVPGPMMAIFGMTALLGAIGDWRFMTMANPDARYRVGRHLWRMSLAMWIATASFFLGQAKFLPEALRITPLLALPVLLVLGTMIYWMVRVTIRKRPWVAARPARGTVLPEAAPR